VRLPDPPEDGNELGEGVAEIAHRISVGEVAVVDVAVEPQPPTATRVKMLNSDSARRMRSVAQEARQRSPLGNTDRSTQSPEPLESGCAT
jgi:hypothetical protein